MIEIVAAYKYYGNHALGAVLLVDGVPQHFTGPRARRDATLAADRIKRRREALNQVIEYSGRHITRLHPSGFFEVGVDNGAGGTTFERYDCLDDAKEALDADIEKLGY